MPDPTALADLCARRVLYAALAIAAVCIAVGLATGYAVFHRAPSVAAPAAPPPSPIPTMTVDGQVVPLTPGLKYTHEETRSGGLLTENHERRSAGSGAGLHTATEGGAVGFTGGSAPNSSLGPDDTAGATGGSSGSLKQTFVAGLNLCQLAAIACAGFAVYYATRKPPAKTAALYAGVAAAGFWFAADHPWFLVPMVLAGLGVIAWKLHLLTSATGALDALHFGIKAAGGAVAGAIHEAAANVAEAGEKPFIDASRTREGA